PFIPEISGLRKSECNDQELRAISTMNLGPRSRPASGRHSTERTTRGAARKPKAVGKPVVLLNDHANVFLLDPTTIGLACIDATGAMIASLVFFSRDIWHGRENPRRMSMVLLLTDIVLAINQPPRQLASHFINLFLETIAVGHRAC